MIISLPIALFTTLLANKIILLIFGHTYLPDAAIALQILIWTIIFMFLNGLAGNLLGSVNKQPVVTAITCFGAVFNISLNLYLIPKISYIGASYATLLTEFILMPILIYVIWKNQYTDIRPLVKDLPKIIISTLIMGIVVFYLNSLNLFLLILVAAIVYLGTLYLTKILDKDDRLILQSIVKKVS